MPKQSTVKYVCDTCQKAAGSDDADGWWRFSRIWTRPAATVGYQSPEPVFCSVACLVSHVEGIAKRDIYGRDGVDRFA